MLDALGMWSGWCTGLSLHSSPPWRPSQTSSLPGNLSHFNPSWWSTPSRQISILNGCIFRIDGSPTSKYSHFKSAQIPSSPYTKCRWFPLYYEMKIIVLIYLLSPYTHGSSILYRKFVHPTLVRRFVNIPVYFMSVVWTWMLKEKRIEWNFSAICLLSPYIHCSGKRGSTLCSSLLRPRATTQQWSWASVAFGLSLFLVYTTHPYTSLHH